jgi:branched-chain amino acid transport system substrate-binding protein
MKEKYGYEVDRTGACGTEAGLIFQLAIEKANSLDTEKVREAIKGLNETTFYGPIKFDDRGINVGTPVTMMQIQKGKRVAVWPSAHADGKLKYPTPKWEAR